ncbi:MAG: T9SS type A sorting domain-containing protein [Chryseobacterium sp.]|nr:T9SS type A sorting domain-containing protein [Chryseobacterium sp.]
MKQTVMAGAGAVLLQPTDCFFLGTNEVVSKSISNASFFPNPASENISFKVFSDSDNKPVTINVTDLSGKSEGVIYKGALTKGNNTINSIPIKKLGKGVKLFEVKTDDGSYVQKVIIK